MASLRSFTRGIARTSPGGCGSPGAAPQRRDPGRGRRPTHQRPPALLLVSGGVCVAIAALVWLGYVATSEWMRYTELLLERRKTEALALTAAALSQDMKGAWTTVLAPMNPKTLEEDPPYDVLQTAATSFARFPYPESFIVWTRTVRKDGTVADADPGAAPFRSAAAVGSRPQASRSVPGRAEP